MLRALAFALAALTLFLTPTLAVAQENIALRVDLIVASDREGEADPSLAHLADQLARQFPQFRAFRQVRTESVTLQTGTAQHIEAAPNVTLALELRSISADTATVVAGLPGGEATVRLPNEGLVFLAGPIALPEGTWIFAIARR